MFNIDDVLGGKKKNLVPQGKKIVWVQDFFPEDLIGGAELTSQALLDSYSGDKNEIYKMHSRDVSLDTLKDAHGRTFWIFGNWTAIDPSLLPTIAANMDYVILEYDYKFCKYRNLEKHLEATGTPCDCHQTNQGKFVEFFYASAKHLFWMSEQQQTITVNRLRQLENVDSTVLSSVFHSETLYKLEQLYQSSLGDKTDLWGVLGSDSWVKGTRETLEYAAQKGYKTKLLTGLQYDDMLSELSQLKGFCYQPPGADTCPRIVIEAKLLGCQLDINQNVQHAAEEWFNGSREEIYEYLYAAPRLFWNIIASVRQPVKISGYLTLYNAINQSYPYVEAISSMFRFCDEVVIIDGGSTDGTWESLSTLPDRYGFTGRYIKQQHPVDWTSPRSAVYDGELKALARSLCTSEICWQQDADEWTTAADAARIKFLANHMPGGVDIVALPVVEWWGSRDKVRLDVTPWKWRLSRNNPDITHGIPIDLRLTDTEGLVYAAQGTDGCDPISKSTGERIQFVSFYTGDADYARGVALQGNIEALSAYTGWLKEVIAALPVVYHDSWLDIERKIRLYRDFWSRHWDVLYGAANTTPVSNNFFSVPWDQVTDEMISEMARKLSNETGGWIFHRPWSGERVPHLSSRDLGLGMLVDSLRNTQ